MHVYTCIYIYMNIYVLYCVGQSSVYCSHFRTLPDAVTEKGVLSSSHVSIALHDTCHVFRHVKLSTASDDA